MTDSDVVVAVHKSKLQAVGGAIRTALGVQTQYELDDMPAAIGSISSGGVTVEALSVTNNGTYTAPTGTAYTPVTVNVAGGGATILSGTDAPAAAQGSNGNMYLQYEELPSGYTRLEYIQSDGSQYIDTGYVPTRSTSAKLKLNPQNIQESAILGASWDMGGFFLMFYSSKFRWHSASSADSAAITTNTDYVVEVRNTRMIVDGTEYPVSAGNVAQSAIRLFSTTNAGGSGASNTKGSFKLYYCDIYEDGSRAMAFIPAKRNSDDAVGLYDIVGGSFYTNGGSGAFAAGSEVTERPVTAAYVKVSGAWQSLIGSDINDVIGVSV